MPNPLNILLSSPWANQGAQRRALLRTAVRGGLLRLSGAELCYGEGFLGSKNLRRLPLDQVEAILIEPDPVGVRGVRVRIVVLGQPALVCEDVNAGAAWRLLKFVEILRKF